MKYIADGLKCITLIALALIAEAILERLTSLHINTMLYKTDPSAIIRIFLGAFVIPTAVATITAGLLGGMWVDKNAQTGFVIASLLSLARLFVFFTASEPATILLASAGIPPIILSAGFTFEKIHLWREARKMKKTGADGQDRINAKEVGAPPAWGQEGRGGR